MLQVSVKGRLMGVAMVAAAILGGKGDELFPPGQISISRTNDVIWLQWTNGLLQTALDGKDNWTDIRSIENPGAFPIAGREQAFRLRNARPSTVNGRLVGRGHPAHAGQFEFELNGNLIAPKWKSAVDYNFQTGLPGINRLNVTHPWYSSSSPSFSVPEGRTNSVEDLLPDYVGRFFEIGGISSRFVGHAGGSTLVGVNSLESCLSARRDGMWLLELDVCVSGDGVPFLSHDWSVVQSTTGLDKGTSAEALAATGQITMLEDVLTHLGWLVLDLIHNSHEDVVRIVDYMVAHHGERVRRDIWLQVYQRPDYQYVRNLDPALKVSFNLAPWSAWGVNKDWKKLISDIVAETDFYVINPSTMVTEDMILFLNSNGLTNTFVPVMHTHSAEEIIRLHDLAPTQICPMINALELLPKSWPPEKSILPARPLFRFTFDNDNPFQNTGDASEITFNPPQNIHWTADSSGVPNRAILTQSSPLASLSFSIESMARINMEAGRDFSLTISARATRFNTPQILAMGTRTAAPEYVAGFYQLDGKAYFLLTQTNNTQTWVLAGDMRDLKWHQYTATVSAGQITTFQDGVLVSAARPPQPLVRCIMEGFSVACDPLHPDRTFDGALDELAYYTYALSQNEVWTMAMNSVRTAPPTPLVE